MPVLRAFVDTFCRPVALSFLALADLFAFYLVRSVAALLFRGDLFTERLAGGLGLLLTGLLLAGLIRSCILASILPRVVRGQTGTAAQALARGWRIFSLDLLLLELAALLGALAFQIGQVALAHRSPALFAFGVAPPMMLLLIVLLTTRQAVVEIAVFGAFTWRALGRAFAIILHKPGAFLGALFLLALAILPLQLAAAAASPPLTLVCGAAGSLWFYATLARVRWA